MKTAQTPQLYCNEPPNRGQESYSYTSSSSFSDLPGLYKTLSKKEFCKVRTPTLAPAPGAALWCRRQRDWVMITLGRNPRAPRLTLLCLLVCPSVGGTPLAVS